MGKALGAKYKVQGWRQSNGKLWLHNQIVRAGFHHRFRPRHAHHRSGVPAGRPGMVTTLTRCPGPESALARAQRPA